MFLKLFTVCVYRDTFPVKIYRLAKIKYDSVCQILFN